MKTIKFGSRKLVYGMGFNDGKYPAYINKKPKKEYKLWTAMLERCYSDKSNKRYRNYIDCFVSDEFLNYSYFYEWCQKQVGFNAPGFDLDKDILIKGNRIYSPENCVFVPREINLILTSCRRSRGDLPVGVVTENRPRGVVYISRMANDGKRLHIGIYDNVDDAFHAYKTAKEIHIKEVAQKNKNIISEIAYNALMNYKVEVFD